jgi:imidazolonepropionase-like amidohydrolase
MGKLVLAGARVTDGRAAPEAVTVVVEGGLIAELRPTWAPSVDAGPDDRVVDLTGHVLVPGLIDAHTHLLMSGDANSYEKELLKEGTPLRTLRAAAHARMAVDDGILTVRDVCTEGAGYADVALREAIRVGLCEGPRILPSGPGISVTGGYLPQGFAPGVCVPTGCAIVDGADAARREVREQVSFGVAWIKVFADWFATDATTGAAMELPTFTMPELAAICDEATRRGVKVAAHVTSEAGARLAIECGVASLEHLGPLTRETLDLAAKRGIVLVPTLSVVENMLETATDDRKRDRAKRRIESARAAFSRALASGVAIAMGTDIGAYPHAKGSRIEVGYMVDYGMPERGALLAATRVAADMMRLPQTGSIGVGFAAELCAFRGATIAASLAAGPPSLVVQGGRVVRDRLASTP